MELYYCDISQFYDLQGMQLLLPERQERVMRYQKQQDKARCLVVGLLMRTFLKVHHADQLSVGEYGKPRLKNNKIQFNFSHSGNYVVLGTSPYEIGVDIEKVEPYAEEVAKRCFTEGEQKWLAQNAAENSFYKIWTAKESIMKATGQGLNMPAESFCALPISDGEHMVNGQGFYLQFLSLLGHELCVATIKPDASRGLIEVKKHRVLE